MNRFFSPSQNISADKIIIFDKDQLHHIRDVLRLKVNDKVTIFDDRSNEYIALIKQLLKDSVILQIQDRFFSKVSKVNITVACAIPKKSKMDDIIEKLTQLGVDRIIPLRSKRVVVRLDKNKEILRHERWRKIASSASKQSQRNTLPAIEPIRNIEEVLSESNSYDLKLIPTLAGRRKTLKEIFVKTKGKNILVIIGPEGDFTPKEIDLAKQQGCIPVSLGNLVLRVDTAAIAVASFIRLYENS